jgi:hypothetical protein
MNKRHYTIIKTQSTKYGQFTFKTNFYEDNGYNTCHLDVYLEKLPYTSYKKTMKCHPTDTYSIEVAQKEGFRICMNRFMKHINKESEKLNKEMEKKTINISSKITSVLTKVHTKEKQLTLFNN